MMSSFRKISTQRQISLGAIFYWLFLMASACSMKEADTSKIEISNVPEVYPISIPFDSIFEIVDIVQIPEQMDYFVARINNVISVSNEELVIGDFYYSNKAFLFNINNLSINSVGSEGEGPEEYDDIIGLDFDETTNKIILISSDGGPLKFLYYSKVDSSIQAKQFRSVFAAHAKIMEGNNIILHHEGQSGASTSMDLSIVNNIQDIEISWSETPPYLIENWIEQVNPLFKHENGSILATSYSNPIIYHIMDPDSIVGYKFKFNKTFEYSSFSEITQDIELWSFMEESKQQGLIENIFVLGDFLFFDYFDSGRIQTGIFNLENKKLVLIEGFSDLPFGLGQLPTFVGVHNKTILFPIYPDEETLDAKLNSDGILNKNNPNPLLVFCKLKNDNLATLMK